MNSTQQHEDLVPSSSSLSPKQGVGAKAPIPWFKQFWPWFLISWPMLAVIGGVITFMIAINNPDGLVEDDYYKAGLAINQTLDRKQTAMDLGLQASGSLSPSEQLVTLNLKAKAPVTETRLLLKLVHPTISNHDIEVPLLRQSDGSYRGSLDFPVQKGDWHLILSPQSNQWRVSARVNLQDHSRWQLNP